VGFPELAERGSAPHIIPRRFRRCRALFRPVFARQQRELDRLLRRPATSPTLMLTPAVIEQECEDVAVQGAEWRAVWLHQSRLHGFVDLDNRLLPWAKRYRQAA
jgi:hypothetical protein